MRCRPVDRVVAVPIRHGDRPRAGTATCRTHVMACQVLTRRYSQYRNRKPLLWQPLGGVGRRRRAAIASERDHVARRWCRPRDHCQMLVPRANDQSGRHLRPERCISMHHDDPTVRRARALCIGMRPGTASKPFAPAECSCGRTNGGKLGRSAARPLGRSPEPRPLAGAAAAQTLAVTAAGSADSMTRRPTRYHVSTSPLPLMGTVPRGSSSKSSLSRS